MMADQVLPGPEELGQELSASSMYDSGAQARILEKFPSGPRPQPEPVLNYSVITPPSKEKLLGISARVLS